MKHGKKYNESAKLIETGKFYDVNEGIFGRFCRSRQASYFAL